MVLNKYLNINKKEDTYILKSMTLKTLSLAWIKSRLPFGCTSNELMDIPFRSASLISWREIMHLQIIKLVQIVIYVALLCNIWECIYLLNAPLTGQSTARPRHHLGSPHNNEARIVRRKHFASYVKTNILLHLLFTFKCINLADTFKQRDLQKCC